MSQPDLTVHIGKLKLSNPVMTASGTFGYGAEFASMVDLNRLGAIVVKGLSLLPSRGNPPPRIVETACGMLNAIGLENVGVDVFVKQKLPFLRALTPPLIVNIYGHTVRNYVDLAARLSDEEGVAGLEVNISCPNVAKGGIAFGVDPKTSFDLISKIRRATSLPLIVKLSPNVSDITENARHAEEAGADAVSLINTLTGMAVDLGKRRPVLANTTGGLSGPAIKPVALRMIWQTVQAVNIPVIGIGGIMNATDALEFLLVGATAIQIGTANFINPQTTMEVVDGIGAFLEKEKIKTISHFIGSLEK